MDHICIPLGLPCRTFLFTPQNRNDMRSLRVPRRRWAWLWQNFWREGLMLIIPFVLVLALMLSWRRFNVSGDSETNTT